MDKPELFDPYPAGPDIVVLPSYFPIPGLGILPVNSFVLKAKEPVLVDAGLLAFSREFMDKLSSAIDPRDLKWLWLTHTDQDHLGCLQNVLEAAPKLKVITTFSGLGKMSLFQPLPMDRVFLLNPGQSIDVGDRKLTAVRPPTFDAPETTGFYDPESAAFFSADCFGALMEKPAGSASEIGPDDLRKGLLFWTKIDAPWLHMVDRGLFMNKINYLRGMSPEVILSSHLPAAHGMSEELLRHIAAVPDEDPFEGPDQHALEALLGR
jgi:flavorubredoxin